MIFILTIFCFCFLFFFFLLQIPYGDGISNKVCIPCHKKIRLAYRIRADVINAVRVENATGQDASNKVEVYKIVSSPGADNVLLTPANVVQSVDNMQNEILFEHVDFVDDNGCYEIVEENIDVQPTESNVVIMGVDYEQSSDTTKDEPLDAVSFLLEKKELFAATKSSVHGTQNNHPGIQKRVHVCTVCDKKFARKSNLVDHLRLHANVRLYKCEYCAKTFVQAGNYRSHLRIHTKERPFSCTMCDKTYNQSSALKVHVRTHTNERNYRCTTCDKGFTNSSDLSKHLRVHDPSQKIKCDHCDKTFAQKVNLKNHIYRQHEHKHKSIERKKRKD